MRAILATVRLVGADAQDGARPDPETFEQCAGPAGPVTHPGLAGMAGSW